MKCITDTMLISFCIYNNHTQKTKTKKKTLTILSGTATVSKYGRFQYLWENVVPAFFARFVPYTNLNTSKRFSDASSLPLPDTSRFLGNQNMGLGSTCLES